MSTEWTEERMGAIRRVRYERQLREEYGYIKRFRVILQSPDGQKNTSYSLEELFDMFELTRNQREYRT